MNALRAVRADQRGVVSLEFLIAFVPVFTLFLGVVQLGLLAAAQLVVQHAAICAARSASVIVDDDPRFYRGAPRGDLTRDLEGRDGPRLSAIRRALHAPLAAITPDAATVRALLDRVGGAASVAGALGEHDRTRFEQGSQRYLPIATALVFPLEPGSDALSGSVFELADRVHVRVSLLLPCTVPIAAQLACERLTWDAQAGQLQAGADASPTLRRALRELRTAPDASRQAAFARTGLAVAVLYAEASLPLQRAPYCYASEGDECEARR